MSEVNKFRLKDARILSTLDKNLAPFLLNTAGFRDPDTKTAGVMSLEVEESMFEPTIKGKALIRDYSGLGNNFGQVVFPYLGIGGYDILELTFETEKVTNGLPIPDGSEASYKFQFLIYAFSQESGEANSLYANSTVPRIITLKLASPEFALMNYLFFDYFGEQDENLELKEDLIIPISKTENKKEENKKEEEEQQEGVPYTGEGLVQFLVNGLNGQLKNNGLNEVPLKYEEALNWIWLKRNYNFYPWGKMASPPRMNQLVQMLAENAVHKDWKTNNTKAANFFFWRTLDSWNFFSLEKLVKLPPTRNYVLSGYMNYAESIQNLKSNNISEGLLRTSDEMDNLALLNSYAYGSNYVFVEPKYTDDPYSRYLDSAKAHIIQEIKYDYIEDGKYWSRLEQPEQVQFSLSRQLAFVPGSPAIQKFSKAISKNRIIDKNYGYFSPGFFNRQNNVPWEYYGYDYSTRQEETLWQTQFDITDLEGDRVRWLYKEIKQKLKQNQELYAKLKNLKEKWKVYKCSICCAGDIPGATLPAGTPGEIANIPGSTFEFKSEKFEKSFNLRDKNLSQYEIVAAGSFSDVLNYDSSKVGVGITFENEEGEIETFQNEWTKSGLTLSYNLNESPYNLSLGEFFSLEKEPDNFVKYRFDLEIKRHEKLKQILEKNKIARQIRKDKYIKGASGYTAAYKSKNEVCLQQGCTGTCLCPTEYPETVQNKVNLVVGAHEELSLHEDKIYAQIDPIIAKLQHLKNEFKDLYSKYWSRKAFFFSRNIDFSTFLTSGNNLFNIKSIKRTPIRGSKYEPFALRKPLAGNMVPGVTGALDYYGKPVASPVANPLWSGTTSTCMYPYEVPPYVDDLGYMNSVDSINTYNGNDVCGVTAVNVYYNRGYDSGALGVGGGNADFWSSFENPYSAFPYSEASEERPKGPIWYRNWLVSYRITILKPPCLNRQPPCFEGDCSCDEINLDLHMHFEAFANYKNAEILQGTPGTSGSVQIINYSHAQLSKNCDGCKIRILNVEPASSVKLYHPWAADELPGLCGPAGSFSLDDYNNYKRSASLFKRNPGITGTNDFDDGDLPPHLVLEGLESFVRVEFTQPIGAETLQDFPEGFVDTHGSEYFLPYIVLATAGPFGAQSARTNIAVIGQDPFGFDLAVKKIKNRDDFANMNLMFTDDIKAKFVPDAIENDLNKKPYPDLRTPFGTSSSWMKTNQNSLFYKPKDGVADLFVPNGVQDIFRASALERSYPAKTWWDMWVSLPPMAVSTFYNRHDVTGISRAASETSPGISYGGPGVGFYIENALVAEPFLYTGGCSGQSGDSCSPTDKPWPLFLHPDTEQFISGAFASDAAVIPFSELFQTAEFATGPAGTTTFIPGKTASVLSNDPSNYVYRIANFPHIRDLAGLSALDRIPYDTISYPVGTLIWGSGLNSTYTYPGGVLYDHQLVHYFDISRKTQYGLVQLNSDSMPSLLSLIGGVGGEIEKIQEYQKWVSNKLIDWYQNTIFDNNFSAQFVVMSKVDGGCKGYQCMNPDGFTGIAGCPPTDPLCNCPCQGKGQNKGKLLSTYVEPSSEMPDEIVLRPDLMDMYEDKFVGITKSPQYYWGQEPSSLQLKQLEKTLSECNLVKNHPQFGESWLGCVWDDPDSKYNCICPIINKNFPLYMKYNRTNATFWETPLEAPLYRTAQMALFNSNKITIDVPGDFYLVTGDVVTVDAKKLGTGMYSRFSGKWIVSTIKHLFTGDGHMMRLVLSRELPHPSDGEGD